MRRLFIPLIGFLLIFGFLAPPAQAGAGQHTIGSTRFSTYDIKVKWQKDTGSYYDDTLSPGEVDTEDDAAHPNAEPWSIYIAPGRCARWAVQSSSYNAWTCRTKYQAGQWWQVHPGDGYGGSWGTTVQVKADT